MKSHNRCRPVTILVFALLLVADTGYSQGVSIEGTIIDGRSGSPVPGLTVSLIHQVLGRSKTAITNSFGQFMLVGIPIRQEPYYLEVYWGTRLTYRSKLDVQRPMKLPPIRLGG
jgi:hypothetical protein